MKRNLVLYSIGLALVFIGGLTAVPADEQKPTCVKDKMDRSIEYRVARSERTVVGPATLVIYISVKLRHFNREDMISLARQLNRDFCKEPRLTVLIFSDYHAAKSLVFSIERPSTYNRDYAALRGGYSLDRTIGKEYVSFSPDAHKPHDEIRIELGNSLDKKGK